MLDHIRRRWIVLALIFVGILVSYVDRGNLSVAAPWMMHDFRITPATMGVILSAFLWTYSAFQIPAGAIVDRFGIRFSYAAGFLVWSLASASIAFSRSSGDVIGLRAVLGMAEAIAPLASISFIRNNYAGKDQGLPTSIYLAGQPIGPALGALVGSILVDRFGWRMMFAITGLCGMVWLPFWLLVAPSKRARHAPNGQQSDPPGAATGLEEGRQPDLRVEAAYTPAPPRSWTWRMLLLNRTFWIMSLCIAMASYFWYFVLTWVPSYMILSRGFSTLAMGRVVSAALFIMGGVNVVGGWAADKLAARIGVFPARMWFAGMGYAATGVVLLLLVTPSRFWALPILTVALCGTGIGNSSFWAISQHVPPENMVGRTVGYLNTVAVAAGGLASIITGLLLGPQKHFGVAIFVAGLCPVLSAFCMLATGPKRLEQMKALLAK